MHKWLKRILIRRSCTSGPTRSWHKRSKRILIQRSCTSGPTGSWHNCSTRILIQRSCTSGPTGSWYKWSTRLLIQGSWNRRLAQVALQNPDTEILRQWSCTSATPGSWYKWSGPKGSWYRDLAQAALQDPHTSDPKGSSYTDPEAEILLKWSYRILLQVVQKDPDKDLCTNGATRSWYKWPKRILIRTEILRQRSCTSSPIQDPATSGPKRSTYRDPDDRDLAQVVLQEPEKYPDTVVPKSPDTEILHKWSYRILIQAVQTDPHTEILKQRDTSGPKGAWNRDLAQVQDPDLIQRSWDRDLAQVLLQDPDTSGPKGSWYRDPATNVVRIYLRFS